MLISVPNCRHGYDRPPEAYRDAKEILLIVKLCKIYEIREDKSHHTYHHQQKEDLLSEIASLKKKVESENDKYKEAEAERLLAREIVFGTDSGPIRRDHFADTFREAENTYKEVLTAEWLRGVAPSPVPRGRGM